MRDGDGAAGGLGALRSRDEDRGGASPTPDRSRERQEPLSPAAQQQNDAAASLTALLAGPSASRRRPADEDAEPVAKRGARTRLTWGPELHGRFLAAVQHLGVNTAVPKTILQARAAPPAQLRARSALGVLDTAPISKRWGFGSGYSLLSGQRRGRFPRRTRAS